MTKSKGAFQILFKTSAAKELRKLPLGFVKRAKAKLELLSVDPFQDGVKKLLAANNFYRIRIGDYRIVYSLDKTRKIITVMKIAHRREIYRNIG